MPPIAVLVALADPTRCRIVEILSNGSQPVHSLASAFFISRPAISRHLRVLKQAKLISETKTGRENRYALHPEKLTPVTKWLADVQDAKPTGKPLKTARKPMQKATESMAPLPVLQPVSAPTPPTPAVVEPAVAAKAPKPRRDPVSPTAVPVSQMGFDF